jgi:hypothetical protein
MIEDEMRRRKVSADFEQISARPVPREFHVGEWIAIVVIIGLLIWLIG